MVTVSFKVTLYGGLALSLLNIGSNMYAVNFWRSTNSDYESRAEKLGSAVSETWTESENLVSDDAWFTTLQEEYDGLSSFDKQNVYCDISSIYEKPSEHESEGSTIFLYACIFLGWAAVAFAAGYSSLIYLVCKDKRMRQVQEDLSANYRGNWNNHHEKNVQTMINERVTAKTENLWNFRAKTALMVCGTGPLLAMIYVMITRMGSITGYSCQEKLYDCSVSGDCTMDNLMVPVALNSSIKDIILSTDTVLAVAIAAGIVDFVFHLVSGAVMFLRSGDVFMLIAAPCVQLIGTALPLTWVYFLDEKVNFLDTALGTLVMGHLPMVLLAAYLLCVLRGSRRDDSGSRSKTAEKFYNSPL